MQSNTGLLRLSRRRQLWADRLRPYRLFVDERSIGDIRPAQTLEIPLSPGPHTVTARIDWCRAKPLRFDVVGGETIDVEIANRWGALLGLWAITFGAGSYLILRRG